MVTKEKGITSLLFFYSEGRSLRNNQYITSYFVTSFH